MTKYKPTIETDSDGTIRWTLNGEFHRADGPAVEWADGSQEWYLYGKRHRTGGPAVERPNGTKMWFVNDKPHRTDGPAYEYYYGTQKWYLNGELHRTDGPAIEWADGTKEWWLNGGRHRADGPAVEYANGHKEWLVKDQRISLPYTSVLTAALNRGMHIPEEALLEMAKATREAQTNSEQIGSLKTILNKHWPMHVRKILATLLMDIDPAIKRLAFSLLGREEQQENISSVAAL